MAAVTLKDAATAAKRLEQARTRRDAAIRAAHPEHSLRQIAEAVGLSKSAVQQIIEAGR